MFIDDLDYENKKSKVYGVVTALVTNNKDPEQMGRVKVTYPWLAEDDESYWARIATMMAGNDRGSYFIPEVDDEVLVAFEHGDIHYPYIIGALWNGQDKVHENNDDGENNLRVIKSRSGHRIVFDDTADKEQVMIETHTGHKVILDDTSGSEKITIIDHTEDRKIVIDSKAKTIDIRNENGKINIFAGDDINIETDKKLNIKTGSSTNIKAGSSLEAKASSSVTIKAGSSCSVEATSNMSVKGAMLTAEASGQTSIKGAIINLN